MHCFVIKTRTFALGAVATMPGVLTAPTRGIVVVITPAGAAPRVVLTLSQ